MRVMSQPEELTGKTYGRSGSRKRLQRQRIPVSNASCTWAKVSFPAESEAAYYRQDLAAGFHVVG